MDGPLKLLTLGVNGIIVLTFVYLLGHLVFKVVREWVEEILQKREEEKKWLQRDGQRNK